jgi:hypothetical protein
MFHNVLVFEVLVRNLGELGQASQNFQRGSKMGINGMFHTVMVFVICTNENVNMQNGFVDSDNGNVDFAQWACRFEQWLGQGSPKMTCPLCLVRGLKR